MDALLCRNRVKDFQRWKHIFDSHAQAHRAAGLQLQSIWREGDQENDVWFLFAVTDVAAAKAFLAAPEAREAAGESGVLEGEYHFLTRTSGY